MPNATCVPSGEKTGVLKLRSIPEVDTTVLMMPPAVGTMAISASIPVPRTKTICLPSAEKLAS